MPLRELERLQAIHRFLNLKINKESELQEIVELAAELCETPIALIDLVNDAPRYFTFKPGIKTTTLAPKDFFYRHEGEQTGLIVIPDAQVHQHYAVHPMVAHAPFIRFYAGAPLITHDGHRLGTICIMDTQPKELSSAQQHLLQVLSKRVIQMIEFEASLDILKQQFLQAKDAEVKLRSFFESSVACHLLFGTNREILAFNKNMADLLHNLHNIRPVVGMKADDILKGASLQLFQQEYAEALSGRAVRLERLVEYKSGPRIWWEVTYEPAYDPDGLIIGVSYNATDITDRKTHEKHIVAQNDSLKQIAYIQSHDLRRPVASILGLVEIFKSEHYEATKAELIMLEDAAKELDERIRTIVELTELETNS